MLCAMGETKIKQINTDDMTNTKRILTNLHERDILVLRYG